MSGHRERSEPFNTVGRCVLFPGQVLLGGAHTVAEIVETSAIDRVIGVGPIEHAEPHQCCGGH